MSKLEIEIQTNCRFLTLLLHSRKCEYLHSRESFQNYMCQIAENWIECTILELQILNTSYTTKFWLVSSLTSLWSLKILNYIRSQQLSKYLSSQRGASGYACFQKDSYSCSWTVWNSQNLDYEPILPGLRCYPRETAETWLPPCIGVEVYQFIQFWGEKR